jgi:methylglutaconyl-CoA hydratase
MEKRMSDPALLVTTDARGVAPVTLNRPDKRNALDDQQVRALTEAFAALDRAPVRAVVLAGRGQAFSAGADLDYMQRMAAASEGENITDATAIAEMLRTLDRLGKPTVARVHGAAYAAGIGLVAACDTVVASDQATFCISEVRLGMVPSTISPYVIAAIGGKAARHYFLTAEPMSAADALRLGLAHRLVAPADLESAVEDVLSALLRGAPRAQGGAKRLIADLVYRSVDDEMVAFTARSIAAARASPEGREGIAAFLAKRKPSWHGS